MVKKSQSNKIYKKKYMHEDANKEGTAPGVAQGPGADTACRCTHGTVSPCHDCRRTPSCSFGCDQAVHHRPFSTGVVAGRPTQTCTLPLLQSLHLHSLEMYQLDNTHDRIYQITLFIDPFLVISHLVKVRVRRIWDKPPKSSKNNR